MGLFFYAALVMSFRYANFYKRETRWKIALETCGMVAFITWLVELGYLTDDPSVPPVRVQQMRPHGHSAYWTLRPPLA